MNDEIKQDGPSEGITSPGKETHEATAPPGGGEPETEAGRKVQEEMEKVDRED